jgi:hypothetical protein
MTNSELKKMSKIFVTNLPLVYNSLYLQLLLIFRDKLPQFLTL